MGKRYLVAVGLAVVGTVGSCCSAVTCYGGYPKGTTDKLWITTVRLA